MVSQLGTIEDAEGKMAKVIRTAAEDAGVAPEFICRGIDA